MNQQNQHTDTKQYRFTIPCLDGQRRFIFCRSINSVDTASNGTGTAVYSTDNKRNAFVAHGMKHAQECAEFFTEHSHGLKVEIVA